MKTPPSRQRGFTLVGLMAVAFYAALFGSWLTHIVVCIKAASWGLLIAGAIFFPIGVIHGIGSWFGWF